MARVRSPNYPAISLPDAIRRVEAIHRADGQNAAARDAIVQHMGFSSVNGASLGVLSALIKFGLLEQCGDKELRVSSLAMTIMYPESDAEKADAIAHAASLPSLFQEIKDRWPERPPSNETLKSYLARRGFAPKALEGVLRSYRETIELASQVGGGYDSEISPKRPEEAPEPRMQSDSGRPGPTFNRPIAHQPVVEKGKFRVSVTEDSLLDISAFQLDRGGLTRLIGLLTANLSVLSSGSRTDSDQHVGEDDGEEREDEQ